MLIVTKNIIINKVFVNSVNYNTFEQFGGYARNIIRAVIRQNVSRVVYKNRCEDSSLPDARNTSNGQHLLIKQSD